MVNEIMGLMTDSIQEELEIDSVCYKPAEETTRFVVGAAGSVIIVDPAEKTFAPVKKGDYATYMKIKDFMKSVNLRYVRI